MQRVGAWAGMSFAQRYLSSCAAVDCAGTPGSREVPLADTNHTQGGIAPCSEPSLPLTFAAARVL
jgi:hypothetical protein